jgi:hypothetical protein
MTAHILALICWIMPGLPMPKPALLPPVPTDAQILQEGQKRANHFCTPDRLYPEGAEPFIVPCAEPLPACGMPEGHPYSARCQVTI